MIEPFEKRDSVDLSADEITIETLFQRDQLILITGLLLHPHGLQTRFRLFFDHPNELRVELVDVDTSDKAQPIRSLSDYVLVPKGAQLKCIYNENSSTAHSAEVQIFGHSPLL